MLFDDVNVYDLEIHAFVKIKPSKAVEESRDQAYSLQYDRWADHQAAVNQARKHAGRRGAYES